jgi:hypothetical membrane protein
MKNSRQVWVTGFMASAAYLICTTISFFNYPLAFSPCTNWLSDLGNPIDNPTGAFLYNLGCILTSICLIIFFLGLEYLNNGDRNQRRFLMIAQVTGILSSLALIVAGMYPLGSQTLIHSISGKAHIFFVGFFLTFSATLFLKILYPPKWLAYVGFLAALINFIYGAFLHSVYIAEWVAIGFFIIYILLVSGYSLKQNLFHTETGTRPG